MADVKLSNELWMRAARLKRDDVDEAFSIAKAAIDADLFAEDISETIFMSMSEEKGNQLSVLIGEHLSDE